MNVAPHIASLSYATKGGKLTPDLQGSAVHQKKSGITLFSSRQILLSYHKAITTDRIDHLVQVWDVFRAYQKHTGPA